ncbi:MAG: hypothetical protein A3C50_02405 [Candidatus Staskawiczbacteria bacterium RIFCSPHIGHO2_02_FULL_43_16]|uniref:Uncharacterized protein n=1 Tax=Candidatus Staskawiczbacteria bacterium RIFCSPHIGHO2_01_FULL_41_41 TaxID=1802203 RepID=A0A1G2HVY7_9BACT|nr:MAG: hypothetical protein A2822_00775 [Candidatus Staskawiczbacteria bacterium RIFCSPHIGHO2_01_FULL_41_41]OGZ68527.1 MAG: hypothetical protein A3C50_02405 [Candidatus Staskawiczbacteria bacterium RIFCSPHIGHO2_02_FULL_43_16]OGZ74330.1 MAG: hypothetical protein A3A12_02840 [Candidatus Staskawiczbacteria bacterium RIFCSPLOWO2_01_FULL_43_17b]
MELNNSVQTNKKSILLMVVVAALLVAVVFFAVQSFVKVQEVREAQKELARQKTNVKVVNFLSLFIQKVLKTDKEISFEDRLKLENAIRDINDPEILAKWEQFTGGTNEAEIQAGVKNLLEILVRKMY